MSVTSIQSQSYLQEKKNQKNDIDKYSMGHCPFTISMLVQGLQCF